MKIKGFIKKKPQIENQGELPGIIDTIENFKSNLVEEFDAKQISFETDLNTKLENLVEDISEKVDSSVEQIAESVDVLQESLETTKDLIGNQNQVIETLTVSFNEIQSDFSEKLDQIQESIPEEFQLNEKELESRILSKVPQVDEKKLSKSIRSDILKSLPKKSGDLKIIRESVEIDPISVIDKIMALPVEKRNRLQLSGENISGYDQTISALRNQLGRGYLHGGGISNITGLVTAGTNIAVTGSGTSTAPYVINSSASGGTWGSITGTLSDQTDLQSALDAKIDGSGAATQIPFFTDSNTLSSDSNFIWNNTSKRIEFGSVGQGILFNSSFLLFGNTQGTLDAAGYQIQIESGSGNGTGAGGVLQIKAGEGESGGAGDGGAFNLVGGDGSNAGTGGNGGRIFSRAGYGRSGNANGGDYEILAGDAVGTGLAGEIQLKAGINGDLTSGTIALFNQASTYKTSFDLSGLTTANQILTIPNATGTLVLSVNGTAPDSAGDVTISTGGAISTLTLATATNTIDNTDYLQEWQWNTLASGTGLRLSSISTLAASNTQRLLQVNLSGANGTTTQTTYASSFTNTHTGTLSTNVAGYFSASGGTNNYAGIFENGFVGIGTNTPDVPFHLISPTSFAFRMGYDTSNYLRINVGPTGTVSLFPVGSGAAVGVVGSFSATNIESASGIFSSAIGEFNYGFSNVVSGTNNGGMGSTNTVTAVGDGDGKSLGIGIGNSITGDSSPNPFFQSLAVGINNTVTAFESVTIGQNITNATNNSLMIGASNTAKMTILSTGFFGFGTDNPTTLVNVVSTTATTGNLLDVRSSAAAQTTTTLINATASGYTTEFTGNVVNFTGVSTTGVGNVLNITSANTTAGNALNITSGVTTTNGSGVTLNANALTTGTAFRIPHTTSVIADTGSLFRVTSSSVDTGGATNGTLADFSASGTLTGRLVKIRSTAAAQTTTTLLDVVASGYTTGYTGNVASFTGVSTTGTGNVVNITSANTTAGNALSITSGATTTNGSGITLAANALTTGTGMRITHTTSVIASGGSLLRLSSTSADTATTTGSLLDLSSSATTGTLARFASATLTTGKLLDLQVSGTTPTGTTQTALNILVAGATSTSAVTTTGATISNTRTNATSGTNIALSLNASGATTANNALVILNGNMQFGTGTGTKIATATTEKIGFWNATPIVQPTTAVAAATFVANTSLIANDTATFDGYTIGQVVKALRNAGLLA